MELAEKIDNFEETIEDLNRRINSLQDIILKMKVGFDLMSRNQLIGETHSHLIKTTEEELNYFLDNRLSDCKGLDICTTRNEKAVMEILSLCSEQNYSKAITLINGIINYIETYYVEHDVCPDKPCLDRAKKIYSSLKNLLDSAEQRKENRFQQIYDKVSDVQLLEGNEKKESALMSALANEIRIKILKQLSKGSLSYSQLERKLGLKGGHFHFHLKNLIKANFVTLVEESGGYSITTNGLIAIKIIQELSK